MVLLLRADLSRQRCWRISCAAVGDTSAPYEKTLVTWLRYYRHLYSGAITPYVFFPADHVRMTAWRAHDRSTSECGPTYNASRTRAFRLTDARLFKSVSGRSTYQTAQGRADQPALGYIMNVEKIAERCGRAPQRLLADTTAMTREDIVKLAERYPDMTVYSPPPPERTERHRRDAAQAALDTPPRAAGGQAWRARMASEEGQQTYRRRKLTERAHGIIKNRGMSRFLVHSREKVRAVCVLQALALNLCWANTLRRRIAAAAAAIAIPAIA